ncbi:non-ribosomal peptide synthetase [Aquimarina latercula]|uniref:non-ribosomal peptide synthetase n=1 Tax=Aquimarina latercula TaxID=987 RepID=UPI0003FF61B8|nr:non-ribosomal peptide synthetase [Aquimarina latercula]
MNSNTLTNIDGYEFSINQKNLWKIQEDNSNVLYNQIELRMYKDVPLDQLLPAIESVVQRHQVLSSKIYSNKNYNYPVQFSSEESEIDYKKIDSCSENLEDDINSQLSKPYSPYLNSPIRFCFVTENENIKSVYIRLYALWGDVYSISFFCQELSLALLDREKYKEEIEKIDYVNYAAWQNELINNPEPDATIFWDTYDPQIENRLEPFSGERKSLFNPIKKNIHVIEKEKYVELFQLSKDENCDVSDILFSQLVEYLSLFEKNELTIGYIPFKRNYEELNHTLGVINKAIPVKIDTSQKINDFTRIEQVRSQVENVQNWSDYFSLDRENSSNRSKDKNFNYCFQFIEDFSSQETEGVFKVSDIYSVNDLFKLKVCCVDYGDKIAVELYYDQEQFGEKEINLIEKQLLSFFKLEPNNKSLELCQFEKAIIEESNNTKKEFETNKSIIKLFEDQVIENPDSIALIDEGNEISYLELSRRANQLSNYLINQCNIKKGDSVAILQGRSSWFVVSILGVLKAGAYYVPIDQEYPEERIQFILRDSKAKTLISDSDLLNIYDFSNVEIVVPSDKKIYESSTDDCKVRIAPDDIAYCIYTSGSTGNPKGCLISQNNLMNYIQWANDYYFHNLNIGNWGLITSVSFDLTVTSLFTSLTRGKKIWIGSEKLDISELLKESFINPDIDILKLTPAHISLVGQLNIEETNIKIVICGGEQLSKEQIATLISLNKDIKIYNEYGPTEATVGCITKEIHNEEGKILIGKPISNVKINLIDYENRPCKIGVIGEIVIEGDSVAVGYLNRPELTKEKFVKNLLGKTGNLYKTGDLARWLPDGNIEYIGRKDDQVKIRGHRIELGEIEKQLLTKNDINQALVLVTLNENSEKELVAYVLGDNDFKAVELRSYLVGKLPEYMLPTYFIQMDTLPLTVNGKVDKEYLIGLKNKEIATGIEYVEPRNQVEQNLALIWEEVLQKNKIGAKDDFFLLGGHSLKATQLINEYHKTFDVKLTLKELFDNLTLESHANLISNSNKSNFISIEKVEVSESYPVSDAQRRLWVLSQSREGSIAYNMPSYIELKGRYDIENFRKAINATIDRHEILRTIFREETSGEVRQWVVAKEDICFTMGYQDLRDSKNKEETAQAYIDNDSFVPFSLDNGPLLRATLIHLSEDHYVFYFNMHHIISDAWSNKVLFNDVLYYYECYEEMSVPSLPELSIQYKDYSFWQLNQIENSEYQFHKEYWLDNLSGELPVLNLPTEKRRPKVKTFNGDKLQTTISEKETQRLKNFCQEQGGSLFIGLLSCWNTMFYHYTSDKDIILGTPIAGRNHKSLEDQIGFYINTLALRNKINPDNSFRELFNDVKENTLSAYRHQSYPFDRLVDDLELKRDISRSPLFDVMLILQNAGEKKEHIQADKNYIEDIVHTKSTLSKFDLEINFQEVGDSLSFGIKYNTDIYDQQFIKNLINHFRKLVSIILDNVDQKIGLIDYLSEKDKYQLLHDFNNSIEEYPKDKTITELFAEQVDESPNKIALVFEKKEYTYRELDDLSNQLANHLLKDYAIQHGEFVGIKLERSEWWIIAELAVLKSGGCYVPLDPSYPEDRISYMEEDCSCKLTIDDYLLESFKSEIINYSKDLPKNKTLSTDLAYVMYTSGSTGKPKGVMIEQRSIIRLVKSTNYYNITEKDTLLATGACSFDATTFEFWGPLLNGAKLILCSNAVLLDTNKLSGEIQRNEVNVMWFTSGWFNQLVELEIKIFETLTTILVGGDKLSPTHIQKLKSEYDNVEIINAYGPTENTTFSLTHSIKEISQDISIGRPINNSQAYILSEYNLLKPIGVVGEICLSGDGLARGYLNNEKATSEKFIKNKFNENQRLYQTGDLGKWLPNGEIQFVGRKDDQIKIRGYRIELGEIEYHLLANKRINDAIVLLKTDGSGNKELVAYVTTKEEIKPVDLKKYLLKKIPDHMVPSMYMILEDFPLTANGKVNKNLLPDPIDGVFAIDSNYMAPRNEKEKQLVAIWEEVLERKNIGIEDDFFALGGHSLKAARVITKVREEFDVRVDMTTLFHDSTIIALSDEIENQSWQKTSINTSRIVSKAVI